MGKSKSVYQLKITLAHVKPPIWRRIEVEDCTLLELHEIIQDCMGWSGGHLWSFTVGGEEYADDPSGELDMASARKPRLGAFVAGGVKKFRYLYDFGDNWEHEIVVEKVIEPAADVTYPRCIEGRRACPPEDCGGPWGYEHFLEVIRDPRHKEHEETLEWAGGEFDPEAFDPLAVL
jgi:hypothetical protein